MVAGLTAAAVVLPKAMAYATVAGLPVAVGLYTAFVPMVTYALLGSSRVLSVSSTATLAILTGAQLGLAVPDGDPAKLVTATATLAGLVGVLLLLARLMRLGFVANFISTPVLTGFKAGIGLMIVLDQACHCSDWPARPPTRACTSSAASAGPTSCGRCRPSTPTTRPSKAC